MLRYAGILVLLVAISLTAGGDSQTLTETDRYQQKVNEEAYRNRFNRAPHAEETTGIKVGKYLDEGIMTVPQLLGANWKFILMTGDDSIRAFDNARKQIRTMFSDFGIENGIQLSRASKEVKGDVRSTSVPNLEKAVGDLEVRGEEGCLVFMTSHGSRQGFYIRGKESLTPSKLNQIVEDHCGRLPTVLLISACYSGIFAEPVMQAPNRVILTAARKDKTSFGCSPEATYTYWDGCLIDNLPKAQTWLQLSELIEGCIEQKEGKGGFARSYPQARIGASMVSAEIEP